MSSAGGALDASVFRKFALALLGATALAHLPAGAAHARSVPPLEMGTIALSQLPAEARQTDRLIRNGGPFPYSKDGTVFGNRERLLPRQSRGYYREYTVQTPGARDRGARRIVCGGRKPTLPDACYYTGDHYSSFKRIEQ